MRFRASAALVTTLLLACGCKPAPIKKPIKLGAVDTGPGSVEFTRRQLQGTWALDKFEVFNAAGQPQTVRAVATLTYDDYGNLTLSGRLLEPLPAGDQEKFQSLVSYSGRITIDPTKHELHLFAPAATTTMDPTLQQTISQNLVRHYEMEGDRLTLTVMSAAGQPTARGQFVRSSQTVAPGGPTTKDK